MLQPSDIRDNRFQKAFWRYAIAVAAAGCGLAIRIPLNGVLGTSSPFLTLFPAVVFAAWFGGLGPSILVTILSVVGAISFYFPRPYEGADIVRAVVFIGFSIFIGNLIAGSRRARARSEKAVEDLRRVEKELEAAKLVAERDRDLLHTTLTSIGDAVITTDAEAKITFMNAVARDLTGWTQEDAAGKAVQEIFRISHEKTGLPAENVVERVMREGRVVNLANHTVLTSKSGRAIPIEDSAAPICDEKQTVKGVVLVFRDVTERKLAETALGTSEERLKLALNAGKIGVWDWDVVQNRIEWSDIIYRIHGVERGSFGGRAQDFAELIHPEDRQRMQEATQAALQDDKPYEMEFRAIQPSGRIVWLCSTGQVVRNQEGEPVRMLGAVTDITAQKRDDEKLRAQWHTFDIALSNTPDFIYVFDLQGRFTYLNQALLRLWRKTFEETVGKNFFELEYPPDLAGRLQTQIQRVIDTGQPVRDQTPFTGPTGETGYYDYIFVPIVGKDGRVEGVSGSTRDLTEHNESKELLRKSEERLSFALEAGGGMGTWDWDIRNDLVYCNPPFAKLFSIDLESAAKGASLSQFVAGIHPEDRDRVAAKIQEAAAECGDYSEEYRVVQPDGSARWVHARGRCGRGPNGGAIRFPGVAFDSTDRKRAEESLRESQERLRAIFDGTYTYIGLLAPDGTLLEANRASLQFAHNTRADVVGKLFWETPWFTATPGAPETVREAMARAAAGEFVRFEVTLLRPSAETPTFDISFHPVRNEKGDVVLIVPEWREITERKRAEAAIIEDRRRWRELLQQSPVAIAVLRGAEHRFEWVNQAYERLVGCQAEALRGKTVLEAGAQVNGLVFPGILDEVYRTGKEFRGLEVPVKPAGGGPKESVYVNFVYLATRDDGGEIDGIFVHASDVTDMVVARQRVEESEAQFRTLAETIPHLAWMADETGNIFWYNRRWYNYTGTTLDDMKGWGWQSLHDPEVLPAVLAQWTHAIVTGDPFQMIFPLRGQDGEFRTFLTRVEPVIDKRGHVVRWFGTNTDITEQRRTEEELRRMNRELEEFAYVASHDLQEPLRMVNIYTQLITQDLDREEPALLQYAGFVQQGVKQMEELIHDLLTFSGAVHSDGQVAGSADLAASLNEALAVLKDRIEGSGSVVEVEGLPKVRGETSQLAHVFQNLLSNAIKYRKVGEPPRIHISSTRDGDEWIISVRDNGIGFELQYSERIFGLFKRLYKEEYPGTGLGLAICKRLVERYGGRIWAEGKPGEGAVFHFSLPGA